MSPFRFLALTSLCFFLSACGPSDTQTNVTSQINAEAQGIVYSIESDSYLAPFKRTVEVALKKPLTLEQLSAVAGIIKASEKQKTDRTFIGYKIEGNNTQGYWATTHYDPDLKVKIYDL